MEKITFVVLVVLYKLRPAEAETLLSLQKCVSLDKDSVVVVRDNSPTPLSETDQAELHKMLNHTQCRYIHTGKNVSLSCIYNETIRSLEKENFLVLFDHDSTFNNNFFVELCNSIHAHPGISLYLPLVYSERTLVSPSTMFVFKGSHWKKERIGIVSSRYHTAINSGMVISVNYLQHDFAGYDERLLFYGTDNYFMALYRKNRETFCVFPYRMQHSLDFYRPGEPFEAKSARFRELRNAWLLQMSLHSKVAYGLVYCYLDLYSIKFAILQRDIRFMFLR